MPVGDRCEVGRGLFVAAAADGRLILRVVSRGRLPYEKSWRRFSDALASSTEFRSLITTLTPSDCHFSPTMCHIRLLKKHRIYSLAWFQLGSNRRVQSQSSRPEVPREAGRTAAWSSPQLCKHFEESEEKLEIQKSAHFNRAVPRSWILDTLTLQKKIRSIFWSWYPLDLSALSGAWYWSDLLQKLILDQIGPLILI